jgi:hypothetical protein
MLLTDACMQSACSQLCQLHCHSGLEEREDGCRSQAGCFAMLTMYMAAARMASSGPHQFIPLICTSSPSARTSWEPCSCRGGRGPPVYRSYPSAGERAPTRGAKLTARATCKNAAPDLVSQLHSSHRCNVTNCMHPTAVGCATGALLGACPLASGHVPLCWWLEDSSCSCSCQDVVLSTHHKDD